MKKIFLLSFLVLGLSSLIGQVLILRELMVSFCGNEFFIGWGLAVWLIWVALGSFLVGRSKLANQSPWLYLLTFVFTPAFLALQLVLIRYLNNFGVAAGQMANLLPALLASSILPAPLCLNLGAQFALAAKSYQKEELGAFGLGQIYLWESLGFVAGGILFSFWLIKLNEFSILAFLALINFAIVFGLIYFLKPGNLSLRIACLIFIAGLLPLFLNAAKINQDTLGWRFGGQKLIKSVNSPYGNLVVTQIGSQYNFYESGLLLGTNKEVQNNEYLAHLALLHHPEPKNVLLVGGGFNGLINEVLKHPVQKLTYLELDSQLLPLVTEFLPADIKTGLTDPRLQVLNLDARYFINRSSDKFDFILINLPSPATALINRLYTQNFLRQAASRLNSDGILALSLPFSPEYQNTQLSQLNYSLFKTLKTVFPAIAALPENNNIFLAGAGQFLSDPSTIIGRFQKRQIKTSFLTENYLRYRLTNERISAFLNSAAQDKTAQVNQDFKPRAYFYNLAYWLTYFYPPLTGSLTKIFKLNFWWLLSAVLLVIFLGWFLGQKKRPQTVLILNMAVFGFLTMAGEIIFILLYQTLFGYLYWHLALLIALLMSGLALGAWQGKKDIAAKKITVFSVIKIQTFLVLLLGALALFLFWWQPENQRWWQISFYLTILVFGYLAGFGFPYLNYLYLINKKDPPAKKNGARVNLSLLYSADLLGAALGAVLPALLLLPLWGLNQTLLLTAVLILSGGLLLFLSKYLGSKNI